MAAVLFVCALGQPLLLAHLNGLTAIGPHASGSARPAAIGSQGLEAADDPSGRGAPPSPFTPHPDQLADLRTASETMAAPPGGWEPPTTLRATAPLLRRLLRIRTSSPTSEYAYLRTASETMADVLFIRPPGSARSAAIGSQGLEAADNPSGHGTPPSPFAPHPDQLADLRTASETMAAPPGVGSRR